MRENLPNTPSNTPRARKSFRDVRLPSFRVMRLYPRYSRSPNIFYASPIRIATICLCIYAQRELGV